MLNHDPAEISDSAEPIDPQESTLPTDPTDRADPTDPIDSTDPTEPIDNTESCDHRDSTEPEEVHGADDTDDFVMRPSCPSISPGSMSVAEHVVEGRGLGR